MANGAGGYSAASYGPSVGEHAVISALFDGQSDAEAAIRELREVGVAPDSISLISRGDPRSDPDLVGVAGVSHEDVEESGLTYRASEELPNDEDLPTTTASMTGDPLPVVTDFEVPPDEPYGGGIQLDLTRDAGMVRRNEAGVAAGEDIYTDFPDEAGGLNPDSPKAGGAGSSVQEPLADSTPASGGAAVGAGLGSLAGLLVGLSGLAIPGIGPVLAAGPLAAALGGAVAGGAAGGVIGALSTVGVPDEYAREYAAGIEQGHTLVSVRTNELSLDLIERVLAAHGGQNIYC